MEVHQLKYFCAIAETGSFTRAAQKNHVAQPSLSQQIGKLEDELGAKLVERLGRSIRLTEYGRALLPRAQSVLRELESVKLQIGEMNGGGKGSVSVGAIPTIAPYFLASRLPSFLRKYPWIQVTAVEETTSELLRGLHEGELDLALLALPAGGHEFAATELHREPLFLVVSAKHRLAQRKNVSLHEVRDEPFVLLKDGHCFRDTAIAACKGARLKPNIVFEAGHFASVTAMVAAGLGVSMVPKMAVEPRKGCRYIPLSDERAYRSIGIVSLRSHFMTSAQSALVQHLRGLDR
jgi:LysR family hydrogen peroxide-inducible transcriptional activator